MNVDDEADDVPKGETLDDIVLVRHVVDMIGDKVIRAGDQYYGYNGNPNMWSSGHLKAAIPYVLPYIPMNNDFLVNKYKSTYRKIKFRDGVYNMGTDTFHPYFVAGRRPLWQFVMTAIGLAISGEVELKYVLAMIEERSSGKGVVQASITAAFAVGLISSGFSANNLLGNDTLVVEAKKYVFLRDPAVSGCRIVWPNENRTATQKGETFIDGNFVKGIAIGGDTLLVLHH
eukprot:jgi/Tetstr1/423706/TSEL_014340.t1